MNNKKSIVILLYVLGIASFAWADNVIWLIKTDSMGDTLWSRIICHNGTYSGYLNRCPDWITISPDGGYVIEGGGYVAYVDRYSIKTDSLGKPLHYILLTKPRDYEYARWGISFDVNEIGHGEYRVRPPTKLDTVLSSGIEDMGYLNIFELGRTSDWSAFASRFMVTRDTCLIKLEYVKSDSAEGSDRPSVYSLTKKDSAGNLLWRRPMPSGSFFNDVSPTQDKGYILAGRSKSQAMLLKLDSLGRTVWTRTYGRNSSEVGCAARQTPDGGYIMVVNTDPDPYRWRR